MYTYIEVIKNNKPEVIKRLDATGKNAKKIEDGMNINLNQKKYHTIINPSKDKLKCF